MVNKTLWNVLIVENPRQTVPFPPCMHQKQFCCCCCLCENSHKPFNAPDRTIQHSWTKSFLDHCWFHLSFLTFLLTQILYCDKGNAIILAQASVLMHSSLLRCSKPLIHCPYSPNEKQETRAGSKFCAVTMVKFQPRPSGNSVSMPTLVAVLGNVTTRLCFSSSCLRQGHLYSGSLMKTME